ncbi:MAG: BamA/TamA family outer membrane protein [Gemmatimonadota bacterium]
MHQKWMGSGYRSLWATPIRVPVAKMGRLGGGGLTPTGRGGGTTTQTLHLLGADGHRYVFRSVDKTPRELSEDLQGTSAGAIIQDQMSSFHPSGALIMARLLDAIDVLHPDPELMVIPDDPRLGEFREQFAGMLVLFEERPDDRPGGQAGFADSRRIVQTDDLFEELEDDPANRVALRELLRARLVDILVGDRDRSVNNHLWARFDDGDGYLWRPLPRDRDQSFVQFDGLLMALARRYDFRFVHFGDEYANTRAVTRNAWDIDRSFLVGVDRATWQATVSEVISVISDQVIREAVARMPREHQALVGAEMERSLRRRRDNLPVVAEEFYDIVFRYADIHGTDVDEIALVEGLDDGGVRVALHRRRDSPLPEGAPHFERTFSPDETREIRIYMHRGDDRVLVQGAPDSRITLRVVGGGGVDELVNSSGAAVTFYDGGRRTTVQGSGTKRVHRSPPRTFSWFEESFDLDWGSETFPAPGISYDAGRGLVPIMGIQHTRFGFGKLPYASRHTLRVGWGRSKPIVEYIQHRRRVIGGGDFKFEALYSGIEVVNFFGLGNETPLDRPEDFFQVDQEQLLIGASLSFGDGERREMSFGPVFKRAVSNATGAPRFLAEANPLGTGTVSQLGLRFEFSVDERDPAGAPTAGYVFKGGASYFPGMADLEESFGFVHGEVTTYLSPGTGNPTLALRAGGKKLWGEFPYYEAAFLGGPETLRGLNKERFAGDAAIYGGVELRVFLARLTFMVPIDMGVFALGDIGRVYRGGEDSSEWHTGRGAGIWLAPLSRSSTVRFSLARSEGRTAFYAGLGFAY